MSEVFIPKGWTEKQQLDESKIYLTDIHNRNTQDRIDIHCFMYYLNWEVCPICNEWLISRVLPKLKV